MQNPLCFHFMNLDTREVPGVPMFSCSTAPASARALFSALYSAIDTLHSLCICSCWIFSQRGWKVQLTVMDTLIGRIFISSAIIIAPYFRSYIVEWQLVLASMCLQKWAHLVRFSAGTESHISMKDSKLY